MTVPVGCSGRSQKRLDDPGWRRLVEVRAERTEQPAGLVSVAGGAKLQQPVIGREFVVVDEGDESPVAAATARFRTRAILRWARRNR
jgi:hypothetical protein